MTNTAIDTIVVGTLKNFIGYCKKHIMEIDDSFLYDEDLKKIEPNAENPTCILTRMNYL